MERQIYAAGMLLVAFMALGAAPATRAVPADGTITSGWVELKQGEAEGTIQMDAKHATNPDPHLLKLSVTRYAGPGKGRFGARNTLAIPVQEGASYEVTFKGVSEGIGVGLVFSLETDDGKVLARTTLPEIGRGGGRGRGRGASASSAGPTWQPYLVSLHARASGTGHLVVTPIETVPVWLENVRIEKK